MSMNGNLKDNASHDPKGESNMSGSMHPAGSKVGFFITLGVIVAFFVFAYIIWPSFI